MAIVRNDDRQEQAPINAGAAFYPAGWCVVGSDGQGRLFCLAPFNERERAEATA
jgi:hypothetical protein